MDNNTKIMLIVAQALLVVASTLMSTVVRKG